MLTLMRPRITCVLVHIQSILVAVPCFQHAHTATCRYIQSVVHLGSLNSRDTTSGVILDADLHQSIITCRKARGVTAAFETALNNLTELRPKIEINERAGSESKPLSGGLLGQVRFHQCG
ncbi:hypothetical protein V8C43DRAFT_272264 [Trichoderma afarasin]